MARPKKLSGATSGHFTKEQLEQKKEEEEILYNYDRLNFENIPPGIVPGAVSEWKRISHIIKDLPISELDQQTVIRYCNYTFLYDDAMRDLVVEGPVVEGKKNPLVDVVNSYSKELKTTTSELGLTINSRLKLVKPAEIEPVDKDPFGSMMNEVDNND
ncbi:P27 family phage terminase small subunit [Brochothrix campestris]|uniref:Phage terminase, small subunit n=1 Tax=Brochothrix campestris FSL F6-1037 TaxID=1265861 RepID=W7C491_9LIST|nr:P27 family phage terminase small subunit [Brochothrix campestris]EUJ34264.1 phage terminase, small subunit [Brochothrix campestris FSL F6-1037]